jgi:hypothetical protein
MDEMFEFDRDDAPEVAAGIPDQHSTWRTQPTRTGASLTPALHRRNLPNVMQCSKLMDHIWRVESHSISGQAAPSGDESAEVDDTFSVARSLLLMRT